MTTAAAQKNVGSNPFDGANADPEDDIMTLTEIHKLEERYPFNEEELEILIRCHDHVKRQEIKGNDPNDFVVELALASPYASYFVPPGSDQDLKSRIGWIETHVLNAGFAQAFKAGIACDAFVEYANQGVRDKSLERFLEGIADSTGRRGAKECLRVLYNLCGQEYTKPYDVFDTIVRLTFASEALLVPNLNRDSILKRMNGLLESNTFLQPMSTRMAQALGIHVDGTDDFPFTKFVQYMEDRFPMFSTPLSTFVHTLLFHSQLGGKHAYPHNRIPYTTPHFEHASDIFVGEEKPSELILLALANPSLGGKWHRLYSSEADGQSFNRMTWSLLGYTGPTVLLIKTTSDAVLGAFIAAPWKQSRDFYGNRDFFLFQLKPNVELFHAKTNPDGSAATGPGATNFMYMHTRDQDFKGPLYAASATEPRTTPHGIGFGGCFEQPRLFIPESLEGCTADFLDHTYDGGNLVPPEALEKFEIASLEVWGVGGDAVVSQALHARAEYRERNDSMRKEDVAIRDKSMLAADMQSGLIPDGHLFEHRTSARGRHEFRVDDQHGGYKLEDS